MQYLKSPRRQNNKIAEINVVPYIDVLLVLLIIFMVTIPIINQSVQLDLPSADGSLTEQIESLPLILTITDAGKFTLNTYHNNSKILSNTEVIKHVMAHLQYAKQQQRAQQVMLRAGKASNYQTVLNGIMLLKQAGAANVGLITEPVRKI